MSHGPIPFAPRPPLLVIHPGPVAKAFIDGCLVAEIPLTHSAALSIAAQLLTAVSVRTNENLPFAAHVENRRAEGVKIHADGEKP